MGLFDKITGNRRFTGIKNAISINDVSDTVTPSCRCGWDIFDGFRKKGFRPFSQMYLYSALNQLYCGMSNVTFHSSTQNDTNYTIAAISSFLDRNTTLLLNMWLYKGYIAVAFDKDNHYWVPDTQKLRFDSNGEITTKNVVAIYSPIYQSKRKSMMDLLKPQLDLLDTLANNLYESTNTMGVLPIISGDSIPANPQFKEDLAKAMTKEYGWSENQLKYYLSRSELKVDTIDLKIKDLEFRDNIIATFKSVLNYLQIPIDMVIGGSTYNNVAEARRYFYENTVKYYSEIFLKIGQALLTASGEYIPKRKLTYHIYNVAGLDKSLSDMCSEKKSYIDVLKSLSESGIDVSEELNRVYLDIKSLYQEV